MNTTQQELHPPARLSYAKPNDPFLKRLIINTIEVAVGRRKLEKVYQAVRNQALPPTELWGAALEKFEVNVDYDTVQWAKVPTTGAVVFICNHPFGVVDGLILGHLVSQVRQRFVFLINKMLCVEPQLQDFLLPIDFNETKEAMQTNLQSRQETVRRLRAGEALVIFPSGGVATSPKIFDKAQDLDWKRFTASVIQQTQATVIPIFIHGQNSRLFQFASHVHLHLRLSLMFHEIFNKKGKTIRVVIGNPIPYAELSVYKDRQVLLDYLRQVVLELED